MTVNGLEQYKTTATVVDEEDKGLLLIKAFQGIMTKFDMIGTYIESKNFEKKYDEISKVKQIIEIIHDSVDLKYGEISKNLQSLYLYVIKRLNEANIKNDLHILSECKSLIKTIYEGFEEAYKKERTLESKKSNKNGYNLEISSLNPEKSGYQVAGGVRRDYL